MNPGPTAVPGYATISPVRILLTNDDGYDAPGLAALHQALQGLGDVVTVAPVKVQSATSHAVTFHRPIAVQRRESPMPGFAVDGRPADCVKLGVCNLVEGPIDLVVSGMNAGANVGLNVFYSGTVGAAREAAMLGLPAIAVSLHLGGWNKPLNHWARAAEHARRAIDLVLEQPIPPQTVVNINVPILDDGREPKGVSAARVSLVELNDEYEACESVDASGGRDAGEGWAHYQAGPGMNFVEREPGTDVGLLYDGWVVVTPLHFDLTHADEVDALRSRLARETGVPAPAAVNDAS